MTLLLTMLPVYLLANIHCAGMCGPLVVFLARHRYRYGYFVGRWLSFSLAGLIAGTLGELVNVTTQQYGISSAWCFLIAVMMIVLGLGQLFPQLRSGNGVWNRWTAPMQRYLSLLLLKDRLWPTFLFGFFTVLLPCGQSMMVFTACALWGDPLMGWINGAVFALLTTPALWLAMQVKHLFRGKAYYVQQVMGLISLGIGVLAICRGLAELAWIPHWVLSEQYHIVIY